MPTYNPAMQKARLAEIKDDEHGLISKKIAELDGVAVTEVTFQAGAKWSKDLKAYAGTDQCELPHVALVTAGTLRVVLSDGSQEDPNVTTEADVDRLRQVACLTGRFSFEDP
jgi:hypothetical protein